MQTVNLVLSTSKIPVFQFKIGKLQRVGGEMYRAILGGGGRNVPQSAPSTSSFGGLRKWDSSGLCPFPLRRMTGREQTWGGGERYHRGGGPNFFGPLP